ncbi:MAG: hypothetical protein ABSH28_14610 [Acidobacteriota bacterium]|jgi:hypothetical protein
MNIIHRPEGHTEPQVHHVDRANALISHDSRIYERAASTQKRIPSVICIRRSLAALSILIGTVFSVTGHAQIPAGISIIDSGPPIPMTYTELDAGPAVGDIINSHFFPGLNFYAHGNYWNAVDQLSYFLKRPAYTAENPRQKYFLSIGHYMRAMIYFHHSTGSGRLTFAREDFEHSIEWNSQNYFSYLELSSLYLEVGMKQEAIATLNKLLAQKPPPQIDNEAKSRLKTLEPSKNPTPH